MSADLIPGPQDRFAGFDVIPVDPGTVIASPEGLTIEVTDGRFVMRGHELFVTPQMYGELKRRVATKRVTPK